MLCKCPTGFLPHLPSLPSFHPSFFPPFPSASPLVSSPHPPSSLPKVTSVWYSSYSERGAFYWDVFSEDCDFPHGFPCNDCKFSLLSLLPIAVLGSILPWNSLKTSYWIGTSKPWNQKFCTIISYILKHFKVFYAFKVLNICLAHRRCSITWSSYFLSKKKKKRNVETEVESQIQKTNLWVSEGKWGRDRLENWDWHIHTTYYI